MRADRQVARFEDGDLWCGEEGVTPPESPAGWYVRPRGPAAPWIGPFPTAEAAGTAPLRGDPFAAARRRLEEWAHARAEPAPDVAASREVGPAEAALPEGRGHGPFVLKAHRRDRRPYSIGGPRTGARPADPVRGDTAPSPDPVQDASELAEEGPDPVPARQLSLDFGEATSTASDGGARPSAGLRRRSARKGSGSAVQGILPLDATSAGVDTR
jgi:hypothetical protein